jgi:hydroxymethylpyrimidine pyrophosphatase-like HAD family hydrolase
MHHNKLGAAFLVVTARKLSSTMPILSAVERSLWYASGEGRRIFKESDVDTEALGRILDVVQRR